MRKLIILFLLIPAFAQAELNANLAGKTLDEFFIVSSELLGKTIIVDPTINGNVKIYQISHAANFRDVFFSTMRAHNLVYVESDTVIRVQQKNQLQPDDKLITKTFRLKHTNADDILEPLRQSLRIQSSMLSVPDVTGVSSILAGTALMITAPRSMMFNIQQAIEAIDYPQQQLRIRAVIIETMDGKINERTVDLNAGAGALKAGFQGSIAAMTTTLPNLLVNSSDFTAFIRYLETTNDAKVLSKPDMMILNGAEGVISVGQELPFITGQYTTEGDSSDKPFQTIERKDVGLMLKVKPFIGANGDITLDITQELSRVDPNIEASDIATSKRMIKTRLKTNYGGVVVLAGMTSSEIQNIKTKVPVLGDIPFIGLLFSSESQKEKNSTLSVVIKIEKV